jgi:hypothetical protein
MKKIAILVIVFSFSLFCLDDLLADDFIQGWKTKGAFTVNSFSIINKSKSTNTLTNENIKDSIIYGEAFIFSLETYGEYILLFHLKHGGKIEIKCFQDKGIPESTMFTEYKGDNMIYSEYIERIIISGNGILREFDKNSRLIKEKKYDSIKGVATIYMKYEDSDRNNTTNIFNGEGVYELRLDSIFEAELIQIQIKINSPY